MVKYKIPYGTEIITIETKKRILESYVDEIVDIVSTNSTDLNHKIMNSSAYLFNELRPGVPLKTSLEFIYFVELNFQNCIDNAPFFKPFFAQEKIDNIDNFLQIDVDEQFIVKNRELVFDTTYLRHPYILDIIVETIKQAGNSNFTVSFKDMYVSYGQPREFTFTLENEQKISESVMDQAVAMNFNTYYAGIKKKKTSFKNVADKELIAKQSISKNKNLIENKLLSYYLHSFSLESEYKFISEEWKVGFKIIDKEDKVHTFKPLKK